MKITGFRETETEYTIGYVSGNAVVWGMVARERTQGMNQAEIIQEGYKDTRNALIYEDGRQSAGKQPSILYDPKEEDLDFIPADPFPAKIQIIGENRSVETNGSPVTLPGFSAVVYNQYGEPMDEVVSWSIDGALWSDGTITIPNVTEPVQYNLTAVFGAIVETVIIKAAPYVKPLAVELAEVKAENAALRIQLSQINANFAGFTDQYYIDFPEKA